jgi:hypothetical protein
MTPEKYYTLDEELIGELSQAGFYCWSCKQLLDPKLPACPKCKEAKSSTKLDPEQVPGGGVFMSNQFTWAIKAEKVMTGRIWYVKTEKGKVIPVGTFRDLINNTVAIHVIDSKPTHSDTIERNKRKEYKSPLADKKPGTTDSTVSTKSQPIDKKTKFKCSKKARTPEAPDCTELFE